MEKNIWMGQKLLENIYASKIWEKWSGYNGFLKEIGNHIYGMVGG